MFLRLFRALFSFKVTPARHTKSLNAATMAELQSEMKSAIEAERGTAPRIALIGKTGVGKSTTMNALFGLGLPIDHVKACTQIESAHPFQGSRGPIIVYDMPGLAEDIDADEVHKVTYARVLAQCDVALWIMKADDRAMSYDQMMLRDVVSIVNPAVASRLIVAVNQVDAIQPGHWIDAANQPSETQKASIDAKIQDVVSKLTKVIPSLTKDRVVAFSAKKRFRLEQLFAAMCAACANDRAWVMSERKAVADFTELMTDPDLKAFARDQLQQKRR